MQEKSFETAQDVKKKLESYRCVCAFCGSDKLDVKPQKRSITYLWYVVRTALLVLCGKCGESGNGSYYDLKEKRFWTRSFRLAHQAD